MAKTLRQIRSEKRIEAARLAKKQRRGRFIARLAERSGLDMDKIPCQTGHQQIVREKVRAGGGTFFRSSACSGCPVGDNFIRQKATREGIEELLETGDIKGCLLVEDKWLFTDNDVDVGEVVVAKAL